MYAFLDGNYKELSSDKEESMTLAVDGKNKSLPKASAGLGYTKVVYDIDKQNSLTLTKTGEGTSIGASGLWSPCRQGLQPSVPLSQQSG